MTTPTHETLPAQYESPTFTVAYGEPDVADLRIDADASVTLRVVIAAKTRWRLRRMLISHSSHAEDSEVATTLVRVLV